MSKNPLLKLVGFVAIAELAGAIGSFFTLSAIPGWYAELIKPSFNPPNWIFGPVWITLYLLMGIAAFLTCRKNCGKPEVRQAIGIYAIQLILNIAWSIIFFGFHNSSCALVDIVMLWISIILTILAFYKISRLAAYLLLPYLAWVSFASVLNYYLMMLN
jgi:translocator protein